MRASKYSEEQIIGFLRQAEAGMPIKEIGRKHGFTFDEVAFQVLWKQPVLNLRLTHMNAEHAGNLAPSVLTFAAWPMSTILTAVLTQPNCYPSDCPAGATRQHAKNVDQHRYAHQMLS